MHLRWRFLVRIKRSFWPVVNRFGGWGNSGIKQRGDHAPLLFPLVFLDGRVTSLLQLIAYLPVFETVGFRWSEIDRRQERLGKSALGGQDQSIDHHVSSCQPHLKSFFPFHLANISSLSLNFFLTPKFTKTHSSLVLYETKLRS